MDIKDLENKKIGFKIKPKVLRGDEDSRTFSIRMNEKLIQRIEKLADETGYSRNELFSILVDFALDCCEIEK